jgi:LemA protein
MEVLGIVVGGMVLVGLILVFMVIGLFNKLVKLKNRFKNAYSQIDVQLNRRYDLIPNLVETAKAFMKHEQDTLEKVIQARNQAHKINIDLGKDPANSNLMAQLGAAEGALTSSMGSFFALAEKYPDLKSDSTMNNLMEELSSTENKVAFARQHFNDEVMFYNTAREEFPGNIIAGIFNFQMASPFEVENAKVKEAVKVSF